MSDNVHHLKDFRKGLEPPFLKGGGGGGTFDPMEARVAKLEAGFEAVAKDIRDIKDDVRELRRDARGDFRILFGAIIAVALGLAGLMAKGFGWL